MSICLDLFVKYSTFFYLFPPFFFPIPFLPLESDKSYTVYKDNAIRNAPKTILKTDVSRACDKKLQHTAETLEERTNVNSPFFSIFPCK